MNFVLSQPRQEDARSSYDAVFGDQVVASKTIEADVALAPTAQEDEAKTKLRKLWGDD